MKFEVTPYKWYVVPKELVSKFSLTKSQYKLLGDLAEDINRPYREVLSAHINDCVEGLYRDDVRIPNLRCDCDGTYRFDDRYNSDDSGSLSGEVNGVFYENALKAMPIGKKTLWESESPRVGACAYMLMYNRSLLRKLGTRGVHEAPLMVEGDDRWKIVFEAIKNEKVCKAKTLATRLICYGASIIDAMFVDITCRGSVDWFYSYGDVSFASRYALFRYLDENTDFPVPPDWRSDYAWEKDKQTAAGYIFRGSNGDMTPVFFEDSKTVSTAEDVEKQCSEKSDDDDTKYPAIYSSVLSYVESAETGDIPSTHDTEDKCNPPKQGISEYENTERVAEDREEVTRVPDKLASKQQRHFFLSPDGVKYTDIERFEKDFSCSRTDVLSWIAAGFTLREAINGGYMAGEADDGRFDFDGKVSYKGLECESLTDLCYLLRVSRRVILTRRRRSMSLEAAIEMPTADRDLFSMLFVEFCKE